MTAYVFTGPTLSAEEARSVWNASYLPPVAHGDVYRVELRRPRAIGIIDGYFEGVPSVWHKEILWAMSQGIHVFGSASMGALRAAELDSFGMKGVGEIYQAYRDGVLEDDDEVTIVHGPPELGYPAETEAMVNIRHTLTQAMRAGILHADTKDALVRIGKSLFYKNRDWHYEQLLECAARHDVGIDELNALRDWLPNGRVNRKRDDALAMLDAMRQMLDAEPEDLHVDYCFEHTELWEEATAHYAVGDIVADDAESLRREGVLDELRLEGATYRNARRGALLRLLALAECDRQRLDVTRDELKSASQAFRIDTGMLSRKDIERWLAENHLDLHAFDRLMEDEAHMGALQSVMAPLLDRYIIDHLRMMGDYARLAARNRDKQDVLASGGVGQPEPDDLTAFGLSAWYFERRLGRDIPDNIDEYAANFGFGNIAAFQRAIFREYLYLSADERQFANE